MLTMARQCVKKSYRLRNETLDLDQLGRDEALVSLGRNFL